VVGQPGRLSPWTVALPGSEIDYLARIVRDFHNFVATVWTRAWGADAMRDRGNRARTRGCRNAFDADAPNLVRGLWTACTRLKMRGLRAVNF